MKKLLSLISLWVMAIGCLAQEAEYFQPYQSTALRLPSVPIIVNVHFYAV